MVRPPGGGAPPDAAASRPPASMASSSVAWPSPFGLVALAAGKHPFPSRTRPLRLHAVMILRPGARESNASPILILQIPCPLSRAGDFFVSLESLEALETLESLDTLEALESLESLESLEPLESLESLENLETLETLESLEALETLESLEALETLESLELLEYFVDSSLGCRQSRVTVSETSQLLASSQVRR